MRYFKKANPPNVFLLFPLALIVSPPLHHIHVVTLWRNHMFISVILQLTLEVQLTAIICALERKIFI